MRKWKDGKRCTLDIRWKCVGPWCLDRSRTLWFLTSMLMPVLTLMLGLNGQSINAGVDASFTSDASDKTSPLRFVPLYLFNHSAQLYRSNKNGRTVASIRWNSARVCVALICIDCTVKECVAWVKNLGVDCWRICLQEMLLCSQNSQWTRIHCLSFSNNFLSMWTQLACKNQHYSLFWNFLCGR